MTTTTETVRLSLDPSTMRNAFLDGGWWPRSAVAADELPDLVNALTGRRGTVTAVMMNRDDWNLPHPRRLVLDGRKVRLGWFTAQPAGLLTAVCDGGRDRFDLVVVPPGTTAASAAAAMSAAADNSDGRRAGDLLTDTQTSA